MSRVSSVVFGAFVLATIASQAACKVNVDVKTKDRFVADETKTDTTDWAGQPISIRSEGVGLAVNGGVHVTAVSGLTKVSAHVRYLAMDFTAEKPDADLSIADAKATFTITNAATGITVTCGHGNSHGNSDGGASGCELMEVQIPVAAADKAMKTDIHSGNGGVDVELGESVISTLEAHTSGGDMTATFNGSPGATVTLLAEKADNITVKMPLDFAADDINLQADAASISLGPFTDAKNGVGAGGRGAVGTGLKLLNVQSIEFAGTTGKIDLEQK